MVKQDLSGRTKLFLVIGDPIAQVKSPAVFTNAALAQGADAVFVPFQISASGLADAIPALRGLGNLCGMVLTIPHKAAFADLAEQVSPRAAAIGAVNVIRVEQDGSWRGDALDGLGFVNGLAAQGMSVQGARVALAGAGGAGASVAVALAEAGAAALSIHDVDSGKVAELCARLARYRPDLEIGQGLDAVSGADIVVNATPMGMRPTDPQPIHPDLLRPHQIVAEMIMQPAETPLLAAARRLGCRTLEGMAVLAGQTEAAMAFFGLSDGKQRSGAIPT